MVSRAGRQKAEGRRQKKRQLPLFLLLSAFCLLPFPAYAQRNQLTVDARTLRMNDMATVTVSLEGSFAEVEAVSPPLENLSIVGEPWVSSEFAWVNGQVTRRKVFRFRIRPIAPGRASVGPMSVHGDGAAQQILAPVVLEVIPDRAFGSNDAESLLRDLSASARDPVFVISEVDETEVFAGEPVRITWFLYNAVNVQQWQVVSVPKLQDFWTEEVPVRNEIAERVYVGDVIMQRVPIRRVVLYPLRSGPLKVDGLTVEAALMRRYRTGVFAGFEGELVETSFTSAPINIAAKPLPPGPPVDVIGDVILQCESPRQSNAGPVVVRVTLGGEANLRGTPPPRFSERIGADVQIEGGEVMASREAGSATMTRQWRFLLFPAREGLLYVPPMTLRSFVPSAGQRKDLRCEAATIEAVAATVRGGPPSAQTTGSVRDPMRALPWVGGGMLAMLLAGLGVPRLLRGMKIRRDAHELVEGRTAAEIRMAIDARVSPELMNESTDRGDAYRALRSLLDAAERERDIAVDAESEIVRRVRELLSIR